MAGLRGQRRAPTPLGSKFFHFHAVFSKNRLAHPFWELAPTPSGKSWIRHMKRRQVKKCALILTSGLILEVINMCICLTVYLVYSLKFNLCIGWSGFNTKHATSLFNAYDHKTSCITCPRSMIAHWSLP